MKPFFPVNWLIILFVVLCCACNGPSKHSITNLSAKQFIADAHDTAQTTISVLEKYIPLVHQEAADTNAFFLGEDTLDYDSLARHMLIGRFINKQEIVAIVFSTADTTIRFFLLDHDTWKPAGSEKTNIPVSWISFEDMDNDGNNELITSTAHNMNNNCWMEVYRFSGQTRKISYAGSFSTDYKIDKYRKQVQETYEGSWYMDASKTLYQWHDDQLVPVKQIILAHDVDNPENGKISFEYYENPSDKPDGLQLKYSEPYQEEKKQNKVWNNFFPEEKPD